MTSGLTPQGERSVRLALTAGELQAVVRDLRSRLACVVEATYWDRPYDERIAAIRGMCDLSTDGMTPQVDEGNEAAS